MGCVQGGSRVRQRFDGDPVASHIHQVEAVDLLGAVEVPGADCISLMNNPRPDPVDPCGIRSALGFIAIALPLSRLGAAGSFDDVLDGSGPRKILLLNAH